MNNITPLNIFFTSFFFLFSRIFLLPLSMAVFFDYFFLDNLSILSSYVYCFSITSSLIVFHQQRTDPNFSFSSIFDFLKKGRKHYMVFFFFLILYGFFMSTNSNNLSLISNSNVLFIFLPFILGIVSYFFTFIAIHKTLNIKEHYKMIKDNFKNLFFYSLIILLSSYILPDFISLYSLFFGFFFLGYYKEEENI